MWQVAEVINNGTVFVKTVEEANEIMLEAKNNGWTFRIAQMRHDMYCIKKQN